LYKKKKKKKKKRNSYCVVIVEKRNILRFSLHWQGISEREKKTGGESL